MAARDLQKQRHPSDAMSELRVQVACKGWEVFGGQGKLRESRIEKLVSLTMATFTKALWKGFGEKVVGGGWVRDEEAQVSSKISLGRKR